MTPTDVAADQAKTNEPDDEGKQATAAPPGTMPPRPPSPSPTVGPPPAPDAAAKAAPDAGRVPPAANKQKQVADIATGDLALIDEELAEHERWGAAAATVGTAGSAQRAEFVAEQIGGGAIKGATGAAQSTIGMKDGKFDAETAIKSPVAVKIAEKLVEKAAIAAAVRLGAKTGAFKSIPGIGPMVGGVLAAYDLGKRDWGKTGNAVLGFGKGADIYEQLANSIESVSTVLEVLTQVANVIAGILGVIVLFSWVAAVASGGALGPLATLLSTVAIKIGVVTMVIDAINSLRLKPMIAAFRALHAFASEADPRDVVAQGNAIEESAGAATGFVTGFAAGAALDKGIHMATEPRPPKVPEHPTPPAKGGEGPHVKAEPPPPVETGNTKRTVEGSPPATPDIPSGNAADRPTIAPAGEKPVAAAASPKEAIPPSAETPAPPVEANAAPDSKKPSTGEKGAGDGHEQHGGDGNAPEPNKLGSQEEISFADLNDVVAAHDKGPLGDHLQAEEAKVRADEPPRRKVSKKQARREANAGARKAAKILGLAGGEVQAGHTQTARHVAESGAPRSQTNDPSTFQPLHSRKGRGLDVTVTSVDPKTGKATDGVRSRHTAQEGLIDAAVDRSRKESGGKLTPQGQAAAGAEVLWQTEGTGFDQREVETKRQSGLFDEKAAIEKSAAVQEARRRKAEQQAAPGAAVDAGRPVPDTAPVAGKKSEQPVPVAKPIGAGIEPPAGKEPASSGKPPVGGPKPPTGNEPPRGGGDRELGGDGPSQNHPGISEIERERLETIGERSRIAGRGRLVEDVYQNPSEQRPVAQRRGEKVPGRPEVLQHVKADLRARARDRFGKMMQEALQDESKHTELTLKTREYLTPEQQDYVRSTGKLPPGVEFHHLMTIADFPEFGDRPETGLGLPSDVHKREGHAGDPTKSLEALTFQDPTAEDQPGFTLDPEARKGHRTSQREIAEGNGATPERLGGVDADLIKERRGKIAKLKGRREPKPGDAATIKRLEAEIDTIQKLLAAKKGPPGGASNPPAPPPMPEPKPEGLVAKSDAPDAAPAPSSPEPLADTPVAAPASPPPVLAPPEPSTPSDQSSPSASLRAPARTAPPKPVKPPPAAPSAGGAPDVVPPEPPPTGPSTRPKETGLPPPPAIKSTEPITERVNPPYQQPPATPEEIVGLRNQVIDTLAERATHEEFGKVMGQQEAHHAANEKPIGVMKEKTGEAISATKAHEAAIDHRKEALDRKKDEEEKVKEKVDDYRTRWGEVVGLKYMLIGVKKFTGLAAALPDEPSPVLSFKNGMLKMNRDATKFVGKLDEAETAMEAQHAGGEQRRAGVKADGDTLGQTGEKAGSSKASLDGAKETAGNVETANKERLDQAKTDKGAAQQAAAALAAQAREKQKRADGLAAAMQSWAQGHRKTRLDAIEQTRKRLEAQGWKVTEATEG